MRERIGFRKEVAFEVFRFGVQVVDATSTGNRILSNSIHANTSLGIDLGADGVTPNDGGDGDGGPNQFQVLWNGKALLDQSNLGAVDWTRQIFLVSATGSLKSSPSTRTVKNPVIVPVSPA